MIFVCAKVGRRSHLGVLLGFLVREWGEKKMTEQVFGELFEVFCLSLVAPRERDSKWIEKSVFLL